jgi:trehalose/maltose hydrolase-like predicted phosphorylase
VQRSRQLSRQSDAAEATEVDERHSDPRAFLGAALVMALFFAGDAFTAEQKARDFAYYERLTVRDSSLSASIQAIVAAEIGHVELAYDYFAEAALLDLDDLEHNTRDGVHIALLAGACTAALAGFGGLRDDGGTLSFTPPPPASANSRCVQPSPWQGHATADRSRAHRGHLHAADGRSGRHPPPRTARDRSR